MMVVIVVMTMSVGGRPVRMMLHHRMVVLNPSIITPLIMLVIIAFSGRHRISVCGRRAVRVAGRRTVIRRSIRWSIGIRRGFRIIPMSTAEKASL
jgi:hypothetical protein